MFNFPPIEYKIFPHSFLRTVVLIIDYDRIELTDELKNKFDEFMRISYPRINKSVTENSIEFRLNDDKSPVLTNKAMGHAMELRSEDGQKSIRITGNSTKITIGGNVYKNRDTLYQELKTVISILKEYINDINKISLQKINVIEFEYEENTHKNDLGNFMREVLSQQILGDVTYYPDWSLIEQDMHTLRFGNNTDKGRLIYGLLSSPFKEENKKGQLIIDIQIEYNEFLKQENMQTKLDSMNNEMYNIFMWVLNKNFISILG